MTEEHRHTQCSSFFFLPLMHSEKNYSPMGKENNIFEDIPSADIVIGHFCFFFKDESKSFSTVLNTILGHKEEHICRVSFVCPVCAHLALQW